MVVDQVVVVFIHHSREFRVELVECVGSLRFREVDRYFSDRVQANTYARCRAKALNATAFEY